jgi:long-chain acyl-CoA synthetase
VFGTPHVRLGEEVAAVVVPREGHTLTSADLEKFLSSRLASFKVPAHIRVQDEPLPRNASGKFLKRQLKDEMAGRQTGQPRADAPGALSMPVPSSSRGDARSSP